MTAAFTASESVPVAESFPRQKARTRNFTSGAPRSFQVAADGSRVLFLRSPAGDDPKNALWCIDPDTGEERLVVDAEALIELAGLQAGEEMTPEERARRERARETAAGIVAFATDRDARLAAVMLAGRLFVVDVIDGGARELTVPGPVFDPRLDPTGRRVAFVSDRSLYVIEVESGETRCLRRSESPTVSWGAAEFVAAEEFSRGRGYWFSPEGEGLLVARVDEAPVVEWTIADLANPGTSPHIVRYPAAGTANAEVTLWILEIDGDVDVGGVEVAWDRDAFPYLADAGWDEHGPLVYVLSRDQRRTQVQAVDPESGTVDVLRELSDPVWIDLVPGVPCRLADGRLVTVEPVADMDALMVDGAAVTPADLEVRAVLGAGEQGVVFAAGSDPTEQHVWRWDPAGGEPESLTTDAGVHTAVAGGGVVAIGSAGLDHDGTRWSLGGRTVASHAETPSIEPRVELMRVGARELAVGLVLPRDDDGERPLPVLLDPYAGPHFARVQAARRLWLESQWFADQGFAVVVADGRGTPGRGRAWAHAVQGDFAGPVLQDQVDALHAIAEREPRLDLGRVAIRGWSFGGYLSALAVLRRPDVFAAGVAGAPVTDWRLYDTGYTERYLGIDPEGADREAYRRSSLLDDAPKLERPLLIIHGLADDNVIVAHTLRLSQRLTEAGRPHTVLPLSGITHMTPQPAVAENLLTLQVEFLRSALASAPDQG